MYYIKKGSTNKPEKDPYVQLMEPLEAWSGE